MHCSSRSRSLPRIWGSTNSTSTAPRWSLPAGVLGALYVSSSTLVIPRLSATLTLGLVVAGQAVAGLRMDHHCLLGVPQQPTGPGRWLAVLLLLAAVALRRRDG